MAGKDNKPNNSEEKRQIVYELVEGALLGKICRKVERAGLSRTIGNAYRIGSPNCTGDRVQLTVFDLTLNQYNNLGLKDVYNSDIISESDLTDEEAKNLEKILKKP